MDREEYKELYDKVMGDEGRNNSNWDYTQITHLMSMEKATMDMVKDNKGKRVLSIGCGNGRVAFQFAKDGWSVTAIDASKKAIEWDNILVKKHNFTNIKFEYKLIEEMTDEEMKQFDVIEMGQTLEHIEDKDIESVMEKISIVPIFIGSVPLEKCFEGEATHRREFSVKSLKKFLEKYYTNVHTEEHSAISDGDKPNIIIFKATK
jgi:ubiquinone/menaquinone biosynthesis C-methylase UbiE